jgi:hypothetical protein
MENPWNHPISPQSHLLSTLLGRSLRISAICALVFPDAAFGGDHGSLQSIESMESVRHHDQWFLQSIEKKDMIKDSWMIMWFMDYILIIWSYRIWSYLIIIMYWYWKYLWVDGSGSVWSDKEMYTLWISPNPSPKWIPHTCLLKARTP